MMMMKHTHDGFIMMMMMKNKKYSRWVGNDDNDEEHEVLTMGW
jgi:hypothetical protein